MTGISDSHAATHRQLHGARLAAPLALVARRSSLVARLRDPALLAQQPVAQQAEQHVVGRALVLGVVLVARPLEVLHRVRLAVVRVDLDDFLRDRQASDEEPTVRLPVAEEGAAQVVAGLLEVGLSWFLQLRRFDML